MYFPMKKYFTHDELPEEVPKGKILYYVSVKPTDNLDLLKSVRDALEKSTKEGMFETNLYSSEALDGNLSDLKVKSVEVDKEFNGAGELKIYLTLNKPLPKDKKLVEIRHNLEVKTFIDASVDANIDFILLFEENSFHTFNFQ